MPERSGPLWERFKSCMPRGYSDDACWPWLGQLNVYDNGVLGFNGQNLKARRLAYEFYCGPIPDGHGVFVACDEPSCVNSLHLFTGRLGTNGGVLKRMREEAAA